MQSSIQNQKDSFHRITSRATLVLLLLILCQCAQSNTIADHPFLHGLDFKGFEQKGPLLIYNRKNIFEYMNGEAENYLPNGFILLYVGKFEALAGIWDGAWKSKSRCVFHRGPYFIRVTANPAAGPAFRPSPDNIEDLARDADRVLGK
jgi:hypothetical protein